MKPLLAVDGDSFAHRAFHALPQTFRRDDGGPANTLVGFMSMLIRLWQAERPRAVVVGWDTLFVRRPTATGCSRRTSRAASSIPEILDQLALLPALVSSTGIVCGKARGFEADDFLAAAVAGERARGGTTLVATSDRDAFQLAAPDVTILQPVRGVSELARIGPADVRDALRRRSRTRCPTSSRCAAIRPTRFPAPGGSGRRPPRRCFRPIPIWNR